MAQLANIEAIEKRLWSAADTLRANSNYASNEYFMPVMGLVFLRHAYSRYLAVKDTIEETLPTRGGIKRPITKEDFSKKSAIFLQQKAQFDYLVTLKDSDDRAKAIIDAMESIEADYETLRGVLPKREYRELDNEILGHLLRVLNPEELKKVDGDVFGRIYEYFLTQFADLKAHDGGEFFTPVSLVSLIANVLEPKRGTVLDPACGSGGMFVQSARFVENLHKNPTDALSFYGLEKNATTINLAKMNLAVHGLVGDIKKAITYYEDPHDLYKKAGFVMANPPFNVDEIDADKIKNDPRLPFGLPGVNKKGKVSNGNYIWISYFYSYLTEKGRAGFVMSSQASSAGKSESKVRQKIVETGDVDVMIAIRSNFFYTRTVPCELWFFNKGKSKAQKDKVLMIDARNIYRKVTRKIYDFSPEQLQNILSIVWLYRGETDRFHKLVLNYMLRFLDESAHIQLLTCQYEQDFEELYKKLKSFIEQLPVNSKQYEIAGKLTVSTRTYKNISKNYTKILAEMPEEMHLRKNKEKLNSLKILEKLKPLAEENNKLIKEAELMYRLANRLTEDFINTNNNGNSKENNREITNLKKQAEETRDILVKQLKLVRYFFHQAEWLLERFPEEKLRDVEGLVKLVDKKEIEENDWSLTPGRYVGVTPEEEDPDFDFSGTMLAIHTELDELNKTAGELAKKISENFKRLGYEANR
ncbi:type I restriction-modification system subunit M [bacterium]|nr:type I restriction-modification system subunit M [bacterium]